MSPLTVICCYSTDGNLKWHQGDYGISIYGTVTLPATATNTIIPLHQTPTASCLWLFLKLLVAASKCKWNSVANNNSMCCCCFCSYWRWICCCCCCWWELWMKLIHSVVAVAVSASAAATPQCEQVIQSEPPKSPTSSWPADRLVLQLAKAVGWLLAGDVCN